MCIEPCLLEPWRGLPRRVFLSPESGSSCTHLTGVGALQRKHKTLLRGKCARTKGSGGGARTRRSAPLLPDGSGPRHMVTSQPPSASLPASPSGSPQGVTSVPEQVTSVTPSQQPLQPRGRWRLPVFS